MAIVFAEGSEHGAAPAFLSGIGLWDNVGGAPAINNVDPMRGTYDIRVGRDGQNADSMLLEAAGRLGVTTIVYLHCRYRLHTAPSAGNVDDVLRCSTNGTNITPAVIPLLVDENFHLYFAAGTYFQLVADQPVVLEAYWETHPGVGFNYAFWVNGTLIYSGFRAHGLSADAGTAIDSLRFGNVGAAGGKFAFDAFYDDIVVDTASRLGANLTLETVLTNADDATEDEWRPDDGNYGDDSWDHVDDVTLNAADYAISKEGAVDTTSQEELWAFASPTTLGTPIGVDVVLNGRRGTSGSVVLCYHRVKLGATAVNTSVPMTGSNLYFRVCRGTDPDGNAWTRDNADDLLAGGQRGDNGATTPYAMRINSIWKTIVYQDPPEDWATII